MIVRLIGFLHDTYPDVLPDVLLQRLATANEQDSEKQTKRGAPSKCKDASKSVIVDVHDSINPRISACSLSILMNSLSTSLQLV